MGTNKKNKLPKKTQVVKFVQEKKQKKVKPRGSEMSVVRARSTNSLDCYPAAVGQPFASSSVGCYVQDGCRVPTRRDLIRQTWNWALQSAGNNTGTMLLPSATACAYNDGQTAFSGVGSQSTLSNGAQNSLVTPAVFASSGICATRLVSAAVRIKNLMNFATISGKLIIAPILLSNAYVPDGISTSVLSNSTIGQIQDIYTNGAPFTNTINFPGSFEVEMDKLINGTLELVFVPTGPRAKSWKVVQIAGKNDLGNGVTGVTLDFGVVQSDVVAGTVTGGGLQQSEISDTSDMMGFYVYAVGMPTAAGVAFAALEWVFHYESQCTPGTGLVPAEVARESPSRTWEQYLLQISQMPNMRIIGDRASGLLGGMVENIGRRQMSRLLDM